LLERALIIREQALGAQHPATIQSLRKLVAVLSNLRQQGDEQAMLIAMPLHTCLMVLEAAAGALSPANQRMPGAHQDPAEAARQLHELVAKLEAEMNRPSFSADEQADLQTAHDLRRQADEKYEQGDYASAQSLLEQALAIQECVLGESHLDHVEPLKKLAQAKEKQGQYSAALPLMQRVADIHIQVLGPRHPTTLLALTDLISHYSQEYGWAAAIPLQERILKLQEESLGADDPLVKMARSTFSQTQARRAQHTHGDEPASLSRSERWERALATLPPEREALLAGVKDIDWHGLHHAYGPADDVPNLLRLLLSDDESVRDDAWQELYSNVWHQSDIYEATARVVPFMLKMLTHDGPPGKAAVLGFLITIAEGRSGLESHVQSEIDASRLREILAKEGQDLETELRKGRMAVEATCRAVSEGAPIYFELLQHENAEIRHLSLDALACSRERAGEIVPRLRALLPTVQDVDTRAKVIDALDALMDDDAEAQRFFTDLMQRGENERITLMATLALIRRAREQTPDAAVDIVLNAVQELGRVRRSFSVSQDDQAAWEIVENRFCSGWRAAGYLTTIRTCVQLGPARVVATLLRMLPLLQDSTMAREAAGVLLDLVFNDGQGQPKSTALSSYQQGTEKRWRTEYWRPKPQAPREASSLTDIQRTVLAAIAAHDAVWQEEHDLLKLYGLPISRQELRRFIA
jgi:tetratricopeptide (TPR) repeat protein